MVRGDVPALWILSKMAMLFFIISLAGLLVVFTSQWRSSVCSSQAQVISQTIANDISNELNSPVEDARQVIQLQSTLAIGGGITSQYAINISIRELGGKVPDSLIVDTYSLADPTCAAGTQIGVDPSWDSPPANDPNSAGYASRLIFDPVQGRDFKPSGNPQTTVHETMVLEPSLPLPTNGGTDYRSYFISLVRCQDKTPDQTAFLFIEDCTHQDAGSCLKLSSPGPSPLCDFPSS
jgi:hypothetical protein